MGNIDVSVSPGDTFTSRKCTSPSGPTIASVRERSARPSTSCTRTANAAARAADLAVRVHEVLGLADLSRTDAIVAPDGEVHFLEVNVSPGLTETSMFPMAVEAAGHELGEVLAQLLARRASAAT